MFCWKTLQGSSWEHGCAIPGCLGTVTSEVLSRGWQGQMSSMALLTMHSRQISWTPLLLLGYLFYLLLGAMVFQLLEKQAETHFRDQFQLEKLKFLQNYTCLDRQALEQFVQVRGKGSHYFGSSIIFIRRNYTIGAKHDINWSAVHDTKYLTLKITNSSPFIYFLILIYGTTFFPSHKLPKYVIWWCTSAILQ